MKRSQLVVLVAAFVLPLPSTGSTVLKIRAGGCQLEPVNRGQAGFLVQGHDGIITALHGVADCSEITAETFEPRMTLNVEVARQDSRSDAALLVPSRDEDKERFSTQALPSFVPIAEWASLAAEISVTAYGFEGNVLTPQRNTALKLGTPPVERLGDILGSRNTPEIVKRGSPSVDLRVIKLEGTVNKGDSGGPVVVTSRSSAVIGLILGAPDPGNSNLAWVAPIGQIEWSPFDRAKWLKSSIPRALADAVRNDEAPVANLQLELSHGAQSQTTARSFPVSFEDSAPGSTGHQKNFFAPYGARFEDPVVETTESVGLTQSGVDIQDDGRRAVLGLSFVSGPASPRVAFRGTVHLTEVSDIPANALATQVDFSAREDGRPYGQRTIEARTAGTWEVFKLKDPLGRVIAEGKVGSKARLSMAEGEVAVAADGAGVTVTFIYVSRPLPPPTIRVSGIQGQTMPWHHYGRPRR